MNIYPVSCFLLMSLTAPSILFKPQGLALPCLVLAGCLAEDSEAPGSRMELCWRPVRSDGQQQIQLHLSLVVKPAVWARGREGTGGEEWGVCACEYVCVCVWGLEVTVEGHWLGCQSYMECVCVKEWEERGVGGLTVSSSWASEQVLLYVSQAHKSPTGETQYKFGFISTPCIDLFWLFFMGLLVEGTNRWFPGENVSALLLNQLSPLWKYDFFFPYTEAPCWWLCLFFSFFSLLSYCR